MAEGGTPSGQPAGRRRTTQLENGSTDRFSQVQEGHPPRIAEAGAGAWPSGHSPFRKLQEPLLKAGLGFSDWASARLFRSGHLATTFSDSEVAPFEKFPINGYDVEDPGVDLDKWTLTVAGAVQKPGEYTLAQFRLCPRVRQNTRHVCVEGWDVIGRFGGAPALGFPAR